MVKYSFIKPLWATSLSIVPENESHHFVLDAARYGKCPEYHEKSNLHFSWQPQCASVDQDSRTGILPAPAGLAAAWRVDCSGSHLCPAAQPTTASRLLRPGMLQQSLPRREGDDARRCETSSLQGRFQHSHSPKVSFGK